MILPAQHIKARKMVFPLFERTVHNGMTFGLGPAGYDVRIAQSITLRPGAFALASTIERFEIPNDVAAFVLDKSSWARKGLSLFNTVLEPGWRGYLTLELSNQSGREITISDGSPIAQIMFQQLLEATELPYTGKYQGQGAGPQPAILEEVR
jgi:dCTP deaminase